MEDHLEGRFNEECPHTFESSEYGQQSKNECETLVKYYTDANKPQFASLIKELYDFGMVIGISKGIMENKLNQIVYLLCYPIFSVDDFHMKHLDYDLNYEGSDELNRIVRKYNCYIDWDTSGRAVIVYIGKNIWEKEEEEEEDEEDDEDEEDEYDKYFDDKYPDANCHRCSKKVTGSTVVMCGGGGGACETWYCEDCHDDGTEDCDVCKS